MAFKNDVADDMALVWPRRALRLASRREPRLASRRAPCLAPVGHLVWPPSGPPSGPVGKLFFTKILFLVQEYAPKTISL
jgi:hypothetical protein